MTVLFGTLAWAAIAAFFIARLDRWAHRWLDLTQHATDADAIPPIPDDLLALALGETEKWAQDQTVEAIRERWNQLHDWNKVRHALGIAEVNT